MTNVSLVAKPDLSDTRLAFVLAEDRLGHYEEFREFFVRTFDLEKVGLKQPGFVSAPSGFVYALVFMGRSGEPFPFGVEVSAVVPGLEPIDDVTLDTDLWAICDG
jgi:hypothetical protein